MESKRKYLQIIHKMLIGIYTETSTRIRVARSRQNSIIKYISVRHLMRGFLTMNSFCRDFARAVRHALNALWKYI